MYFEICSLFLQMARTQKNKATAAHLGLLKARLSKYKRELIETDSRRGGGGGGTVGHQFEVAKSGDARVGLIGFPSVGKSTMLSKLTSTESEVASYEFTTLTAIPGVIHYKGSKIQLVDLPGIIEGAKDGKGRGRQIIGVGRTCDMILIVLDGMKDLRIRDKIEDELHGFGIRVNKQPPNIKFQKKDKGGVSFTATCAVSNVDEEQVKTILAEYRIHNAEVCFKGDYEIDDLIDVVEGNRIYMPVLYVINKVDQLSMEELNIMGKLENTVFISAHHEWGLDDLLSEIWERLKLVRVYTKPKGQIPDYDSPVILKEGRCKIEHFCMKIHKHMVKSLKYANVWGMSVKHQPQKVGKDHVLQDEDVVQIVKQKGK